LLYRTTIKSIWLVKLVSTVSTIHAWAPSMCIIIFLNIPCMLFYLRKLSSEVHSHTYYIYDRHKCSHFIIWLTNLATVLICQKLLPNICLPVAWDALSNVPSWPCNLLAGSKSNFLSIRFGFKIHSCSGLKILEENLNLITQNIRYQNFYFPSTSV
jgi:uncharacterized membrane-anchored protein YitT (DUF2179 family)